MASRRRKGATKNAISDIDLIVDGGGDPPPLRRADNGDRPAEDILSGDPVASAPVSALAEARSLATAPTAGGEDEGAGGSPAAEQATAVAPAQDEAEPAVDGGEVAVLGAERAPAAPPGFAGASPEVGGDEQPRRKRRWRSDELIGVELHLPDEILFRARSIVRRHRTGAQRSLGAAFVLSSYARVVDELLGGEIDVSGIDSGMDEEMDERVRAALRERLTRG